MNPTPSQVDPRLYASELQSNIRYNIPEEQILAWYEIRMGEKPKVRDLEYEFVKTSTSLTPLLEEEFDKFHNEIQSAIRVYVDKTHGKKLTNTKEEVVSCFSPAWSPTQDRSMVLHVNERSVVSINFLTQIQRSLKNWKEWRIIVLGNVPESTIILYPERILVGRNSENSANDIQTQIQEANEIHTRTVQNYKDPLAHQLNYLEKRISKALVNSLLPEKCAVVGLFDSFDGQQDFHTAWVLCEFDSMEGSDRNEEIILISSYSVAENGDIGDDWKSPFWLTRWKLPPQTPHRLQFTRLGVNLGQFVIDKDSICN